MRRLLIAGTVLVTVLLAGAALYLRLDTPPGWGPRHAPSGEPRIVFAPDMPFADYLTAAADLAETVNARRRAPFTPDDLAWRLPFAFEPNEPCADDGARGGILMVHGLTDSPATMRSLGRRLARACFHVRAIALPGHGTAPGELTWATVEEWLAAVRYGLNSFQGVASPVFGVGLSTGAGLLYAHLLETAGDATIPLAGLVALSPGTEGPRGLSPWTVRLAKMSWLTPRGRYPDGVYPDRNPGRYQGSPQPALYQYLRLQKRLGDPSTGQRLSVPSLFVMSIDDLTVPPDKVMTFFCERLTGPKRFLLLNGRDDQRQCADIETMSAAAPDVREVAHAAVPNAPDHPVFGRQGFVDCRHYWPVDRNAWHRCKSSSLSDPNVVFGNPIPANSERFILRQSSFNPAFTPMADRIVSFLQGVASPEEL